MKVLISAGTIVVGYAGWFLGELVGLDFFWCFIVSCFGSMVGIWLGWKCAQLIGCD